MTRALAVGLSGCLVQHRADQVVIRRLQHFGRAHGVLAGGADVEDPVHAHELEHRPRQPEVADAAVFLPGPGSRAITGEVVMVDAGFHITGI